jgi:RNA polymerase sigma-70 factor, ECF subfamily
MHPTSLYPSPAIDIRRTAASRDMELVEAARAGSGAAFEELQNRYSDRLYQRIFSITRNREDAEDALQDTFLRAYVALNSFEGRSQFSTWLTRIAINSALMTIRKRRSRAEISFGLPPESGEHSTSFDVRDTAKNPEQLCELRQRYHYALRAVNRLDPKLRTAIAIRIKQECSIKEAAGTLDLSAAAVKTRIHRARKRLGCCAMFAEQACNPGSPAGRAG